MGMIIRLFDVIFPSLQLWSLHIYKTLTAG